MRFLTDENFPHPAAHILRAAGFDVVFMNDIGLAKGATDPEVCATAVASGLILLSLDRDMKVLVVGHGQQKPPRFPKMNLISFKKCGPPLIAQRLQQGLSLIRHEGQLKAAGEIGRIHITIMEHAFQIHR